MTNKQENFFFEVDLAAVRLDNAAVLQNLLNKKLIRLSQKLFLLIFFAYNDSTDFCKPFFLLRYVVLLPSFLDEKSRKVQL